MSDSSADEKQSIAEISKPDYWYQGFGNDWLDHFYELESLSGPLSDISPLPMQWGSFALLALLSLVFLRQLSLRWMQKRLDQYRYFALQELMAIQSACESQKVGAAKPMLAVIKRCCLVFTPRPLLNRYIGTGFADFLNALLPPARRVQAYMFTEEDISFLQALSYKSPSIILSECRVEQDKRLHSVVNKTEYWIKWHQAQNLAGQCRAEERGALP